MILIHQNQENKLTFNNKKYCIILFSSLNSHFHSTFPTEFF